MVKFSPDSEEDIQPIAELESRAMDLLRQIQETHRPVMLTENGEGILMDLESYEELLEELQFLRDFQRGLAAAAEGRVTPHEELKARLLARFS